MFKYFVIKKYKRIESDLLCVDGDVAVDGKPSKKSFHFLSARVLGMPLIDKVNELLNPGDLGLFGSNTVSSKPDLGTD